MTLVLAKQSGGGSTQNLWETIVADTGSAVANIATDTLTISGGANVTTSISGDTLTINATNDGDGIYDGDGVVPTTTEVTITDTLEFAGGVIVDGTLKYEDGNESNGFILTSDGVGNATWQSGAGSGLVDWIEVVGTSQTIAVNTAYVANNASVVDFTLPVTSALGDVFFIVGKGIGGWSIKQNAGQTIHFGNVNTVTGDTGELLSVDNQDAIALVCTTSSTDWTIFQVQGNVDLNDSSQFNQFSMQTDGIDEFFDIDRTLIPLADTTTGTWSCWVKPVDATPATVDYIVTFGDTNANELMYMSNRVDGKFRCLARDAGITQWVLETDSAVFVSNEWTHVALSQDGVSPVLYVNGVAVAQTFLTSVDTTKWFNDLTGLDNGNIAVLDFNSSPLDGFYTGNIDEVAFWNSALTAAEITVIYNLGAPTDISVDSGNYVSSIDLVGWYRMGELGVFSSPNWYLPEAKSGLNNRKSLFFDGVDEDVNIDNALTPLATTTTGTWSAWVKPTATVPAGNEEIIVFGDTDASRYLRALHLNNGKVGFLCVSSGVQWNLQTTSTSILPAGVWTHVSFVQDGISPVIYINGIAVSQSFSTTLDKTQWFSNLSEIDNGRIGALNFNSLGSVQFFNGNIDEVTLWNANLSAAQVLELYADGSPEDASTHSLSANLTSWYRMGDEASFDTNIYMSEAKSGLENKKSLVFDGVDEYMNTDVVLTNELATTTTGTWSCWIKPVDATPGTTEIFMSFGDTLVDEFIHFQYQTTGELLASCAKSVVNQWQISTDAAAFTDNVWSHIALVQDGIAPVLYVDGVAVAQTLTSGADDGAWFNDLTGLDNGRIADRNYGGLGEINHFNGNIDEVAFWNTGLSAAQVTELYANGSPEDPNNHSATNNLVAYYKMGDGDTIPTILDNSTNTNNATTVNMEAADNEFEAPLLAQSVNMETTDNQFDAPMLAESVNMELGDRVADFPQP